MSGFIPTGDTQLIPVHTGYNKASVHKMQREHQQEIEEWRISRDKFKSAADDWQERAFTYRDALRELVIEYNIPVREVANLLRWKERQEVENFHSDIFVPTDAEPDEYLINQEDQVYIDAINSFVKSLNKIRVQEVRMNAEYQAWKATCEELVGDSKASKDQAKKLFASYKKDDVPVAHNLDHLESFRQEVVQGMDDSCKANIDFIVKQAKQAAENLERKNVYRHGWKSTCIDMAKKLRMSGKDLLSIFHESKCRIYEQDFFLD